MRCLTLVLCALLCLSSVVAAKGPATKPATTQPAPKKVQLKVPMQVAIALKYAGKNQGEWVKAIQKAPAAQREGMLFLIGNMPPPDLQTLTADFLLENVAYAYKVMDEVPWGKDIPKEIFLNDVLPYCNLTERRDNWRKDFYQRFLPLIKDCKTSGDAGMALNCKIFKLLKVHYNKKRKKADNSPQESIEQGMATCTGLSILLVDACRAVGVPARFVGTPLWTDKSGNHSWVEIWHDGAWHFTGGGEPAGTDAKSLDSGWFTRRAVSAKRDHPHHAIYAASYKRTGQAFPMAWAPRVGWVPAVNVTDRYTRHGKKLPNGHGYLQLQAVAGSRRVPVRVVVTDAAGKTVFTGTTNNEKFDMNDHLAAVLPLGKSYTVAASFMNRSLTQTVTFGKTWQLATLNMATAKEHTSGRFSMTQAERTVLASAEGKKLAAALKQYFDAAPETRGEMKFTPEMDALLAKEPAAVKKMAWLAYAGGWIRTQYIPEVKARHVKYEQDVMPYVVRPVGTMPTGGWPLFIAMHGGGRAPKALNDSQWRIMMRYYRDHAEKGGYLYAAPRAPRDTWNSFYAGYNIHLTHRFIRQMILFGDVDPNKVFLMGYSHGGYGVFFHAVIMPDHFAAMHASAAAPMGWDDSPRNLRHTALTCMIGSKDTAHGRIDRVRWFGKFQKELRAGSKTDYRGGVTIVDHGHGGLPDRDKIRDMYAYVRNPVPRQITWRVNSPLGYFLWLSVTKNHNGLIEAECKDNTVTLTIEHNKDTPLTILLDERLVDFGKPVIVVANSKRTVRAVKPSVKTLCEILHDRGDPELVFTSRVSLNIPLTITPKPKPQPKPKSQPATKPANKNK